MKEDKYDWEAIVEAWKAGAAMSALREQFGISERGLQKGLAKRGLKRAPGDMVRDRAQHYADMQAIRDAAVPVNVERTEALAELGANVLTQQRRDLRASRHVGNELKRRLMEAIQNSGEIEESIIEYFGAEAKLNPTQISSIRQRMTLALGAVSLPAYVASYQKLIDAEIKLTAAERTSYRLDEEESGEKRYEDYLREVHDKIIAKQKEQKMLEKKNEDIASGN